MLKEVSSMQFFLAGLPSLSNGIFLTWLSPFILKISRDKENYNISEEQASKFVMIPFIVLMFCCPVFSELSDVYGRKRILLMTIFVDLTVWILKAAGSSVYVFYLARVLVGVSDGIMFASLPAYLGEITAPEVRGTWGNATTVYILLGELLVTVVGSYFSVQETCYILIPIPVIFFVLFSFMPESPNFYIMRGRYEKAKQSLRILNRKEDVTTNFLSLKADVERQMSEKGTWKEVFVIDSNRRAFVAALLLRMSHTFGGARAFVNFTQYIFDESEETFTSEVSSMIFMSFVLLLSVFASFAVNWLGRKRAYIGSLAPCGIVLLIESIYFHLHKNRPDIDTTSFSWVPLVGMILYSVFSSYGIGLMPTLMLRELFSASFRAKAMSVLMFPTGIMAFISSASFCFLSFNYGLYAPFLFFACCDMISAILFHFT